MPRRFAVEPAQLVKFFDEPPQGPDTVTLSRASRSRTLYDSSLSWDGLSVDPRPFSRLNSKKMVSAGPRPQGVAGGQTLELQDVPTGGIFGNAARKGAARARTLEQTSLDFALKQSDSSTKAINSAAPCLAVSLGKVENDEVDKKVVVMEDERFSNMKMWPPSLREVPVPETLFDAGEQTDTLLHPKARRKIMELERDASKAWTLKKRSVNQKMRSDYLLKHQHSAGVVGVDSAKNPESEIYQEQAERLRRREDRRARSACLRKEALSKLQRPKTRYGYDFIAHEAPRINEKLFQSKGGIREMLDHDARLFMRQEFRLNERRRQLLRDRDLLGKNYNIVQHTLIDTLPSTIPEQVDKRMAHPCQASLERGRNLQGSLTESC